MKKIGLYRFITTFCLFPVSDWGAFVQRFGHWIIRIWIIKTIWGIVTSKPFYITGLVALLIWSPDTVAWFFIKIGEIEMMVFGLVMSAVMPDIFGVAGGQFDSWSDIWSAGLNALPAEMVEIMNGLGVAQIMGMITATMGAMGTVRIYRAITKRAGL